MNLAADLVVPPPLRNTPKAPCGGSCPAFPQRSECILRRNRRSPTARIPQVLPSPQQLSRPRHAPPLRNPRRLAEMPPSLASPRLLPVGTLRAFRRTARTPHLGCSTRWFAPSAALRRAAARNRT